MRRISQKLREKKIIEGVFRLFSLKLLIISLLFIAALFFFVLIIHEAVFQNEKAFDNSVFRFFGSLTSHELIGIMKHFTFFGSATFLLPAYSLLIAYFVVQRKYRYSLHIATVAVTSTAIIFLLKELTRRNRPDLPIIEGITNYSFPSGHTLSTFIFCGIFVYIIWHSAMHRFSKWLCTTLLFCFALAIGISRIILRVHYPTDVLASFCLGTIWALSSLWVMRKISRKAGREPVSTPTST